MDDEGADRIVKELRELRTTLDRIERNTGWLPEIITNAFLTMLAIGAILVVVAVVTHWH
jgi:hypothetical protein